MARAPTPVRQRLMRMMLLTSAAAIALTCIGLGGYEYFASRNQMRDQVVTLSRVIAANSTASLAFRDDKDAFDILAGLRSAPSIAAAALYDEQGVLFVTYPADAPIDSVPQTVRADGYRFSGGFLEGFQPVRELADQRLGTLYVRSDMRSVYGRFWSYALIAAVVMGASLLFAYFLSRVLQNRISAPLLTLADTARAISERGDFSVRAPLAGEGEFELLTSAFNQMLARIEGQNSALIDNEERLRAVLNSALSAVIVMDSKGIIIDWNAHAEKVFGRSRDEALGRELAETIIPERHRDAHRKGLQKFLRTRRSEILNRTIEMSALRRDGSEFPVEISIALLHGHTPTSFCGFVTDISERRDARTRLQTQLARLDLLQRTTRAIGERQDLHSIFQVILRNLEDNLPIDFGCICLYEPEEKKLTVETVGAKSAERAPRLGIEPKSQLPIDENGLSRCVRGVLVYEPDVSTIQFAFPQRLTAAGLLSLVAAPLIVESQVFGVLIVARDRAHAFSSTDCEFLQHLSEHVALASHQAQLYTALQEAYDNLRQSQNTLLQQERLRALGQMASGVAHDINNAISPIALYTEALLEHEQGLSGRARDYLSTIQRAIADVAQTVTRMREFYRQRDQEADLVPVDLNVMVHQALNLTRARWNDMPQERGIVIDVRTDLADDLPKIMGSESDIRDALTNLIFNAVDAMPDGGTLTLRTKLVASEVDLEVTDTGSGMDEETRRRCIEPFFTTKGERGTGMGLAMVYGMAKRQGAQIEIDSAVGRGTTMRLRFIIAKIVDAAHGQLPTIAFTPSRQRLLVIDDDPLLREALSHILQSEGHDVTTVDGGQAGIEAFTEAHRSAQYFDLVMTDLGMPYVDGRSVAAAVKKLSPHTPVVLLTGWGQRLSTEQSVLPNVDVVLSKPPKLAELRRALAELRTAAGNIENTYGNAGVDS
jgi:PAS domain S-box-containing protein